MNVPDLTVGKRLFVGEGSPWVLGVGPLEQRGSAYIEGALVVGDDGAWPPILPAATVMIGPLKNSDSPTPIVLGIIPCCRPVNNSPYSLAVNGPTAALGPLDVDDNISCSGAINAAGDIVALGNVKSQCGGHILAAKKNFDIKHPSKKGYRLRHTCPEAPYNDVYIRGKVKNKDKIALPSYWKKFVDKDSITVQLQPIGAHQDVIIKRIDDDYIYLQAKGGMPINCYYHVFAERSDGEKLIPEYKGKTPEDYPGNNDEYSVSGYHYDVRQTED
jgi:hypothetical protein